MVQLQLICRESNIYDWKPSSRLMRSCRAVRSSGRDPSAHTAVWLGCWRVSIKINVRRLCLLATMLARQKRAVNTISRYPACWNRTHLEEKVSFVHFEQRNGGKIATLTVTIMVNLRGSISYAKIPCCAVATSRISLSAISVMPP